MGTAAHSLPTHPRSEPSRGFLVRGRLPKTPWSPRSLGDPQSSLPGRGLPRQPGQGPGLGCSQDPTPIPAAYGSQTLPRGWDRGTALSFRGHCAPEGIFYVPTEAGVAWGATL